jgi:hypothetical protein
MSRSANSAMWCRLGCALCHNTCIIPTYTPRHIHRSEGARTRMCTCDAKVWPLSLVQGPCRPVPNPSRPIRNVFVCVGRRTLCTTTLGSQQWLTKRDTLPALSASSTHNFILVPCLSCSVPSCSPSSSVSSPCLQEKPSRLYRKLQTNQSGVQSGGQLASLDSSPPSHSLPPRTVDAV